MSISITAIDSAASGFNIAQEAFENLNGGQIGPGAVPVVANKISPLSADCNPFFPPVSLLEIPTFAYIAGLVYLDFYVLVVNYPCFIILVIIDRRLGNATNKMDLTLQTTKHAFVLCVSSAKASWMCTFRLDA
jgi:hypothetical protein